MDAAYEALKNNDLAEAARLYAAAVKNAEQLPETEDNRLDLAVLLSSLAWVYVLQGRYSAGEPLLMRALGIREEYLASDDPDIAAVLASLADIYQEQARFEEAEDFYKRALEIQDQGTSGDADSLIDVLNALGSLYNYVGRYRDAALLI